MNYELNKLLESHCTNANLKKFGWLHYSYINQIFGDITVRDIIQEVMKKEGTLIVEPSGPGFENSFHHVFQKNKRKLSKVCSSTEGYQDFDVDINDNLCQSYSLMTYLNIDFDKTPSNEATIEMKHNKHMSMIGMYRTLLANEEFIEEFNELIHPGNNKLWKDDMFRFNIIQRYNTGEKIITVIKKVIDIWEKYGWMYFIGNGECIRPVRILNERLL